MWWVRHPDEVDMDKIDRLAIASAIAPSLRQGGAKRLRITTTRDGKPVRVITFDELKRALAQREEVESGLGSHRYCKGCMVEIPLTLTFCSMKCLDMSLTRAELESLAAAAGMRVEAFRHRLLKGWSVKEAAEKPKVVTAPAKAVVFNGEVFASVRQLAAAVGVGYTALCKRLAKGETADVAIARMRGELPRRPASPRPPRRVVSVCSQCSAEIVSTRRRRACDACVVAMGAPKGRCRDCGGPINAYKRRCSRCVSRGPMVGLTEAARKHGVPLTALKHWRKKKPKAAVAELVKLAKKAGFTPRGTFAVAVDGITYPTLTKLARALGLSIHSLRNRRLAGMTTQDAVDSLRWSGPVEMGGRVVTAMSDVATALSMSVRDAWDLWATEGDAGLQSRFAQRLEREDEEPGQA